MAAKSCGQVTQNESEALTQIESGGSSLSAHTLWSCEMTAHQSIAAQPLSKFAFCDLALESALQLDRARGGGALDTHPLRALAEVLCRTSDPSPNSAPAAFIESSYYQPFQRLLQSQNVEGAQSIDKIRDFFGAAADRLRSIRVEGASAEELSELVKFCVALHKELIRELKSEDGVGVHEWRVSDIPA